MADRNEQLQLLYDEVVKALRDKIKEGSATAAHFSVARSVLSDAGISADPAAPTGPTKDLERALQDFDDEEAALPN